MVSKETKIGLKVFLNLMMAFMVIICVMKSLDLISAKSDISVVFGFMLLFGTLIFAVIWVYRQVRQYTCSCKCKGDFNNGNETIINWRK